MSAPRSRPIAAIIDQDRSGVDELLAGFASQLRAEGWRVRGLLQEYRKEEGKDTSVLVDLETGASYLLFQDLGPGSSSCRVDPRGVAAASVALRKALAERPDLVIANRFGALESEGGGLANEMLALMSERVPLLTVVPDEYLDAWRRFSGGAGVDLPCRLDALQAWFAGLRGA